MAAGILDNLEKLVTDDLTSQTATALGEKYEATNHAIAASAAVILNGMLKASRKPASRDHVTALITDPANDGALLSNLTPLFKGQVPSLPVAGLSSMMQGSLFGSNVGPLAHSIGKVSGIRATSSASVMNIMTPLIMASVGKELRASGDVSANGLSRLLENEASAFESILPQDLGPYANSGDSGNASIAPASIVAAPIAAAPAATIVAAAAPVVAAAAPVIAAVAPVVAAAAPVIAAVAPVVSTVAPVIAAVVPAAPQAAAEAARLAVEAEIRRKAEADILAHRAAVEAEARRKAEADALAHRAAAEAEVRRKVEADTLAQRAAIVVEPVKTSEIIVDTKTAAVAAVTDSRKKIELDLEPKRAAVAVAVAPAVATATVVQAPVKAAVVAEVAKVVPKPHVIPTSEVHHKRASSDWTWALPLLFATFGAIWWLISTGQANQRATLEKERIAVAAKATADAEAKRLADAAAAVKLAADAAAKRKADEDAAELRRKAEADAAAIRLRLAAETKAKADGDSNATRLAIEADIQRKVDASFAASRLAADNEAKRKIESDTIALRVNQELEAKRRADAEAEAKRKADAEALVVRSVAEAEAKRKADAAALAARLAAEAEAKRKADADALAVRLAAEAEAKRKADAAALAVRLAAEADAKRKADAQTAIAEAAAKRATDLNVCRITVATALRSGAIRFAVSSATLTGESSAVIERIATAIKACPPVTVRVEGHTNSSGNADANKDLSEERAKTVRNELTKAGVSAASITALGLGQTKPIAENDTVENKAKNRRIEVSVEPI